MAWHSCAVVPEEVQGEPLPYHTCFITPASFHGIMLCGMCAPPWLHPTWNAASRMWMELRGEGVGKVTGGVWCVFVGKG